MAQLFIPKHRRSTVLIPPTKAAYAAHLIKFKDPMETGYPSMLTLPSTSKILSNEYSRKLFNVNLNNNVLKSWIVQEEWEAPAEILDIPYVPRAVQLHAGESFQREGTLGIQEALKSFIKDRIKGFVIVIPVFDRLATTPNVIVGFLVSTHSTYFPVQVADAATMNVFTKEIMEEDSIIKILINAQKELPIFWVQAECSPKFVLCLTTAAINILKAFAIEHYSEATEIHSGNSLIFPFWKFFDVSPIPVSVGYIDGLKDSQLNSVVKSVVSLTTIILAGSTYVPFGHRQNWTTIFKFNRLRSIDTLKTNLTQQLGLNFWPAVSQAIEEKCEIPLFVICFLYANFGSSVNLHDVGFVAATRAYNEINEIIRNPEDFQQELQSNINTLDGPYLDHQVFKYLASNIILKHVQLHEGTEMGTIGEMLRRVSHYIPCCLP